MKNKDGIFTALLTPYKKDGSVNLKVLKELVDYNLKMGVTGFYVGGSTAETFLQSTDERKLILETVKNAAPDSMLIAHVGSLDEREAVTLGKLASELEYDAISSVTPFYYKFTPKEIKDYYVRIAEESKLPMLVYYFPAFSGVNLGIEEISSFLSDPRFMGIKFTSNDFFTMRRTTTAFPDKSVYNGFDEMLLSGLSMGATGAIGSTYNFMADKFVKIYSLFKEGKIAEAMEIQSEADKIIAVLCKIGVMQAEKEVLNQLGFDFGICRKPFGTVSDEDKKLIATEIIPFVR